MRHHLTAITAGLVLAFATTGCASAQPPGQGGTIVAGGSAMTAQEEADAAILDSAMEAFSTRGYAGLTPHLQALKEALGRAPASYGAIERRQNGSYIVRTDDMAESLMLSAAAEIIAKQNGDPVSITHSRNVYPMIAMLLASDAVERRAFAEAHVYLDKGLALQPGVWFLVSEKAVAYAGQQEWQQALRVTDAALRSEDMSMALHREAILRKHGFALIELGRLDEAQAAYEEILENTPDDEVAKHELAYIAELRRGAAPSQPTDLIVPGGKGQ